MSKSYEVRNGDYEALIRRLDEENLKELRAQQQSSIKEHNRHAAARPQSFAVPPRQRQQSSGQNSGAVSSRSPKPAAEKKQPQFKKPGQTAPAADLKRQLRQAVSSVTGSGFAAADMITATMLPQSRPAQPPKKNSGRTVLKLMCLVFSLLLFACLASEEPDIGMAVFSAGALVIVTIGLITSRPRPDSQSRSS